MPNLTITLGTDTEPEYSHEPPWVQRGDTITFQLRDRTDIVKVTFTDGSPLPDDTFQLDGSNNLTNQKVESVKTSAPLKRYPFIATHQPPVVGEDPEPPGTLTGGVDVSTDPPKY